MRKLLWSGMFAMILAAGCGQRQEMAYHSAPPEAQPSAMAQEREYHNPNGEVVIRRASGEIFLDGNLWEADWQRAEPLPMLKYHTHEPSDMRTEVKMLWDDENLYVSIKAYDKDIIGTYKQRNTPVFRDDVFEAFICPVKERPGWYSNIEINTLGSVNTRVCMPEPHPELVRDLPGVTEPDKKRPNWYWPGLQVGRFHEGTMNDEEPDEYWVLEFSVPWSGWKVFGWNGAPRDGERWRANLFRMSGETKFPEGASHLFHVPEPQGNHSPEHFGDLVFSAQTW